MWTFDTKDTYYGLYAESDMATAEDYAEEWTGMSPLAEKLLEKITD